MGMLIAPFMKSVTAISTTKTLAWVRRFLNFQTMAQIKELPTTTTSSRRLRRHVWRISSYPCGRICALVLMPGCFILIITALSLRISRTFFFTWLISQQKTSSTNEEITLSECFDLEQSPYLPLICWFIPIGLFKSHLIGWDQLMRAL